MEKNVNDNNMLKMLIMFKKIAKNILLYYNDCEIYITMSAWKLNWQGKKVQKNINSFVEKYNTSIFRVWNVRIPMHNRASFKFFL